MTYYQTMLNVGNKGITKKTVTEKSRKGDYKCHFGVTIVNFEHGSHITLVQTLSVFVADTIGLFILKFGPIG